MNKLFSALLIVFLLLIHSCNEQPKDAMVKSPDGAIVVESIIENGKIYYSVTRNNHPIIGKSLLGFVLDSGDFSEGFKVEDVSHSSFKETWEQHWGEELYVENAYNQMIVTLVEEEGLRRRFSIIFRVFDDGLGFRYEFPEQENLKEFIILDELTEFSLEEDHTTWSFPAYSTEFYEGLYEESLVSELDTVVTPLTMKSKGGLYLSIHEANLTDYASMNLAPIKQKSEITLKSELTPWSTGEKVFMKAPSVTPWRTLIIADKPGDLMLSRLMLNLNEPCRLEDISWIKPGKYIGIWWGMHMEKYTWAPGPKHGATTENAMRYIDFAAKYGFSGVLVEGWNFGWENDWTKEGDKFSFTQSYPDFDMDKVANYAKSKNVKVIGHHETGGSTINYESQLDSAYAFYKKYGVDVVKTGYVSPLLDQKERHSSQYGVRHYRKVIETAAKYGIMIDNHEPAMPTGLQRTYPNLMTQEGVRGQEYNAWSADGGNPPNHTTIIPFTRGLAGPMDFTPAIFNFNNPVYPNTRVQSTLAKQLAEFVILYSPLQMAADMIENYEDNPAFEFVVSCPTNWSKTVIPNAEIGEYLTVARKDRDSENWYVGSATNGERRKISIMFDFLDEGVTYLAKVYRDSEDADWKENPYGLLIEELEVNSMSIIELNLASGGGAAIELSKK